MQPGGRGLPNRNENPDPWSLEQSLPRARDSSCPATRHRSPSGWLGGAPRADWETGLAGVIKAMLILPVLQVQKELMLPGELSD